MKPACCVKDCDVKYFKNPENHSFHRFPVDPKLNEIWIKLIKCQPKKISYVCTRHFEEKYIRMRNTCKILSRGAIPTLFLPVEVDVEIKKEIYVKCAEKEEKQSPPIFIETDIKIKREFDDDYEENVSKTSPTTFIEIVPDNIADIKIKKEYDDDYEENVSKTSPTTFLEIVPDNIVPAGEVFPEPTPATVHKEPEIHNSDSDSDAMFDTPKEAKLRLLLKKERQNNKILGQTARQLKQRNGELNSRKKSMKTYENKCNRLTQTVIQLKQNCALLKAKNNELCAVLKKFKKQCCKDCKSLVTKRYLKDDLPRIETSDVEISIDPL